MINNVYTDGGSVWYRVLYVNDTKVFGVSMDVVEDKYWVYWCGKFDYLFDEKRLRDDVPEEVMEVLFDPLNEIEVRKQALRKGIEF